MINAPAIAAALVFAAPLTLHGAATRVAHYERQHHAQVTVNDCRWLDHRQYHAACLVRRADGVSWVVSVTPRTVNDGSVAPVHMPPVTFSP
jgi:hypothetical protein